MLEKNQLHHFFYLDKYRAHVTLNVNELSLCQQFHNENIKTQTLNK